ncbi:MAG: exosortase/archaeosortase family protein [Chloroflexi bacterium]|nr:exosortase/archaeosortase family protein [Chloroflexota bacterium]
MSVQARLERRPEPEFVDEFKVCWRHIPQKGLFLALFISWLCLFHFLGNSTLGYVETRSLFGWLKYAYANSPDDEHGFLIPLVVLVLYWWKRKELLAVPKANWWPALGLVSVALLLHLVGYVVQQTRISVVAFFVGLYGLTGLIWGGAWLRASFFPYLLFVFCLPLATVSERITFPLRLLATKITAGISGTVLGIDVIQNGTQIFDAQRTFQYEIAAACSGLRSLTATLAIAIIYGFMTFRGNLRRLIIIGAAIPLAVAGNVFRLMIIIVAAEAFGQEAGDFVHNNFWLSLLPYLPALGGIALIGFLLREDKEGLKPGQQLAHQLT